MHGKEKGDAMKILTLDILAFCKNYESFTNKLT